MKEFLTETLLLTLNIFVLFFTRSWKETATREIAKRGPERVLISHIYCEDIRNENSNFHVYDLLNAEPYVAILFVGPSLRERNNERTLEFQSNSNINYFFKSDCCSQQRLNLHFWARN